MQVKRVPYLPAKEYLFLDQKRQMKLVTRIRKQIAKFEIKPEQLGFATG
jgi:transposase